jgi:hypothetical protein
MPSASAMHRSAEKVSAGEGEGAWGICVSMIQPAVTHGSEMI